MMAPDPFAVLGLAPTLDAARVKRAYFEAVARHPPHRDPEAFRRVRKAYEEYATQGMSGAFLRSKKPRPRHGSTDPSTPRASAS